MSAAGETKPIEMNEPINPEALRAIDPGDKNAKPQFYIFEGKRYTSAEEFNAAMAAGRPGKASTAEFNAVMLKQIEDDKKMREMTKKLFEEFKDPDHGKLSLEQMIGFVKSAEAELHIHPDELGQPDHIFWRYDFSGDGLLDEDEAHQVISAMLRLHQDKLGPGKRGVPQFRLERKSLRKEYEIGKQLGKGGQGKVFLAKDKKSGLDRVVKFFEKRAFNRQNWTTEDIKNEFELLTKLDHHLVQRLYDVFEDKNDKYLYMVSEPYLGGDLQDLVPRAEQANVKVTQRWLGKIVQQVVKGVQYLHQNHVMHCDLKEANAAMANENLENPSVVVIDFGLADKLVGQGQGRAGTPGYMPPEVWAYGLWTPKGDIHALGVMMFQMFSGRQCFPAADGTHHNQALYLASIEKKTIELPPNVGRLERYQHLGPLITEMLKKKLSDRPTATQTLKAPFFTTLEEQHATALQPEVLAALSKMKKVSNVQAAILSNFAGSQNLASLQKWNKDFIALDRNNDGFISEADARSKLSEVLPAQSVDSIVSAMLGDNGQVAYTLFMGQLLMNLQGDVRGFLETEFRKLDKDRSGDLSKNEVKQLLNQPALKSVFLDQGVDEFMKAMDADESGKISLEEFLNAVYPEDTIQEGPCDIVVNIGENQEPVKINVDLQNDTIATIKQKLQANSSVDLGKSFGLTLENKTLPDDFKIGYNIRKGSTLNLVVSGDPKEAPKANDDIIDKTVVEVSPQENKFKMATDQIMFEEAHSANMLVMQCVAMGLCCMWVPIIFIVGASNTLDHGSNGCDVILKPWMYVASIAFVVLVPFYYTIRFCLAKMRAESLYGTCISGPMRMLPSCSNIVLGLTGILLFSGDGEGECVKDEDGLNPRTLALIWGIIVIPLQVIADFLLWFLKAYHSGKSYRKVEPH